MYFRPWALRILHLAWRHVCRLICCAFEGPETLARPATKEENAEINCEPVHLCVCRGAFSEQSKEVEAKLYMYSISTASPVLVLDLGRQKFISTAPAAELFYLSRRIQLETVTWFLRLQFGGERGSRRAEFIELRWR